jgi:sulfide:quinone oxidoreductase
MASRTDRTHVLIAGGGVAALEAALALRELAGDRLTVTMLAPERHFTYRPLSVGEPFDLGHATRYELDAIGADRGFAVLHDTLAAVEPGDHRVVTGEGDRIPYDTLVLALGARPQIAVAGALPFRGPQDARRIAAGLRELGTRRRAVFAVPPVPAWTLPVYELALLTARWARERERSLELTIVSPEVRPLEVFGTRAGAEVGALLERAGIAFRGAAAPRDVVDGALELSAAERVPADLAIALPRLDGPAVQGIPCDANGFVDVDEFCRVVGVDDVYAVGDMTSRPIKQGGLAAQQAVTTSTAIAFAVGADVAPQPYAPVLRALLLTGETPRWLRAEGATSELISGDAPWWPAHKIATRYLAPYLGAEGRAVAGVGGSVISGGALERP